MLACQLYVIIFSIDLFPSTSYPFVISFNVFLIPIIDFEYILIPN